MIPLKPTDCIDLSVTKCTDLYTSPSCYDQYPVLPCGITSRAGGPGVTRNRHAMGSDNGHVTITYDMYSIPDQLDVYYEGVLIATTGEPVSEVGTIEFDYVMNRATWVMVVVTGPEGTAWEYEITCPE